MNSIKILKELIEVQYPDSAHPSRTVAVRFRTHIDRCNYNYRLGFSPQGQLDRQVSRGPAVVDLFGWFNAEPTIIARNPIPDPRPEVWVDLGDQIEIEGYGTFEVGMPKGWDSVPQLTAVIS